MQFHQKYAMSANIARRNYLMTYDENVFKEKANRKARKIWIVFAVLLSANYGSDASGGLYPTTSYLIFLALCWLPLIFGEVLLRVKGWATELYRYDLVIGYGIFYTFVICTTASPIAFTYILPVTSLLVLYKNRKFMIDCGIANALIIVGAAVYRYMLGFNSASDMKNYQLQLSCIVLCYICYVMSIRHLNESDGAMTDSIRECGLLAIQDIVREVVALEALPEKPLAHARLVELHLGVDAHNVSDESEVAERDSRLEAVAGNAPVGPQHVIHIKLADPLDGLLLESLCRRRIVRILVSEEFIGNLAREQHLDVGLLTDVLADKIHADGGADGGDVERLSEIYEVRERVENVILGKKDLGMAASDEIRHAPRVLGVDRPVDDADGESAYGLAEMAGRDGADEARIQPTRE